MAVLPGNANPFIVAHRGASADAPENTLPAFQLAWRQHADAIEGDFHLTRDRRIVCFHDKDTARITGRKRLVAECSLEQLRKLDAGAWKGEEFAGTRIPTLEEVLELVPDGKVIYIEIKTGPEIVPILIDAVESSALTDRQVVVIAFDEAVIAAVKRIRPGITANWLHKFEDDDDCIAALPALLRTLKRIGADGLGTNPHPTFDGGFLEEIRNAGFAHHTWTVDDPVLARRLLDAGTGSITTNKPGKMRAGLRD